MRNATTLSTIRPHTGVNDLKRATGRSKMLIGESEVEDAGGFQIISTSALWGLTAHW